MINDLRRHELLELKQFFKQGEEYHLFEILFVLDGVKPGVFINTLARQRAESLVNMLRWFDLYVSMRSILDEGLNVLGWKNKASAIWTNLRTKRIYATKDSGLYKDWNRFLLTESYFSRNASRFLGYPQCCVDYAYNTDLYNLRFQIYSLAKDVRFGRKTIQHLREFMIKNRFIGYMPCSIYCQNSQNNVRNFDLVAKKYKWLVGDLLEKYFLSNASGWASDLHSLAEISRKPKIYSKLIPLLLDRDLAVRENLRSEDLVEIVRNPIEARKNIAYGMRLFRANWRCMLDGL